MAIYLVKNRMNYNSFQITKVKFQITTKLFLITKIQIIMNLSIQVAFSWNIFLHFKLKKLFNFINNNLREF